MNTRFLSICLSIALCAFCITVEAQRLHQTLGRGVVAVYGSSNGSEGVTVTWRRLAQEPEDMKYNLYVSKTSDGGYAKLNATPLSNTNYATTLAKVPYDSYVAVTTVRGDIEGPLSKPYHFLRQSLRNIYMEIRYDNSPLDKARFTTKFVWPCDLNGDGEMDYVVDRCPVDGSRHFYLEGYLADGTFLWNVDLGVNEMPCDGQNDNLCAYDIDCDGKGEVIVQTSDGTRFWNQQTCTWGLYVMGCTTADSDGDGIFDYEGEKTRNPPRYMTVIDGMTGAEKASAEFVYDEAYNRTNKAQLMGDEYNKHEGHVGIFYHDGVHPAIVGEWHTRSADGNTHYYRNVAFAYDFQNGKSGEWCLLFSKPTGGVVFHMIRIADVDGDGCDEMLSGEYAMDQDGSTLYRAGIAHGDRFRTSDIDPDRPGLETFAIQQNAGDMLGMILYDAASGNAIKKWHLSGVGDVGRGECMDVDRNHLGWEMWSTMDGVYDAKGNLIDGLPNSYPTEGIWWDGQLDREVVQTSDSHYNIYIQDYNGSRLIQPGKESGYELKTSYGKRAKFWGDIIGDWREEIILIREVNGVCQGIVGLSTDYTTSVDNIYCLQQDPHYRGDCTTRGYYQSPNPGFYLGYDMPRPQLPPFMQANAGIEVYDLTRGNATITPRHDTHTIYAMPVKGQTLTIISEVAKNTELWKSQQGKLVIDAERLSPEKTIISEGELHLAGTVLQGIVDLRARGTLSGSGHIGKLQLEGAINYEGGRLIPQDTLYIDHDLVVNKKTYVETNIERKALLTVTGNLSITANLIFNIPWGEHRPGTYKLIEYTGSFSGKESNIKVLGLTGISYAISHQVNAIYLTINEQREPQSEVLWTGALGKIWDYKTENFTIEGNPTSFVSGDSLVFDDKAKNLAITLNELFPIGGATFLNETKTYTIQGEGGFSGDGDLILNGKGRLILNAVKSDYTGKTLINNGFVTIKELADAGLPSSIGAAGASYSNFQIGKATVIINSSNTATNRGIQLNDTATINIANGTVALKGQIRGKGTLQKTGSGQLNITYAGANDWAGTILQAGTLAMGAWNTTFGKTTSPIHVIGNATINMFDCNSSSTMPNVHNTITIDEGKTLTFHAGSRCNIGGVLLGQGTYKINFPYVRGDVSTNTSRFEGIYEVKTSNCRFVQAMDLGKATLKMDEGSYAAGVKAGKSDEVIFVHKVGTLTGTGTLGTGTWQVTRLLVRYKVSGKSVSTESVAVNGTLSMKNPIIELNTTSSTDLPDNAELQILKGNGNRSITGHITIIPEQPKDGWKWNTSRLVSDGILTMEEDATSMHNITDFSNENKVYDLLGRPATRIDAGRVYIKNGKKTITK